jgi:transcriptional regulator with XRE-family HTH domain
MTAEQQHALFGAFLRARREEIAPEAVGLPRVGHPRRVRGLRREEVAQLANVSTDYYTRLEQGKLPGPSETVLAALVHALRLEPDQENYLRSVASRTERPRAFGSAPLHISPAIQMILDNLHGLPTLVLGRHMDILAWNPLAATLFIDFGKLSIAERNVVRLVFLHPDMRSRFQDWPSAARTGVSLLRMGAARMPDDPRLVSIVSELSLRDESFRRWWRSQRVVSSSQGQRTYVHPLAGTLDLDWQTLLTNVHPDQTIVVLTPLPESASARALQTLAAASA